MLAHFKLDLAMLIDGMGETRIYLGFSNVTNIRGSTETFTDIDMTWEWDGNREFLVLIDDEWEVYDEVTLSQLWTQDSHGIIEFDANIITDYPSFIESFQIAIESGFMKINEVEGQTTMILYRLNDEKDKLDKNLILVNFISGNFKAPIGIKNIEIDVVNYNIDNSYNYVYIPKLKRYYFITNIQLVNKDYARLFLQEDVLMTWKVLIKNQIAFITRNENSNNSTLVDDRRPLENTLTIVFDNGTRTSSSESLENINFDNVDEQNINVPNFMIVSRDKRNTIYSVGAITPSLDNHLPTLAPHNSSNMNVYFTSYAHIEDFIQACMNDDATVSYVDAIIYLPFDPRKAFNLTDIDHNNIYVGDKMLDASQNRFVANTTNLPTASQPYCTYETKDTYRDIYQSAYLCIFDGKFEVANFNWINHEPYANYELNIPFVGFIKLNSKDFINQRILIYYSMDLKSGNATAYVYNKDHQYIIWSGTCQLGVKLDITSTNNLENLKQKQSADTNMILGLLASALSVGVGIASENPVAIAGGVLSGSKAIASNVNTHRMLFSRAQTTFGSSDGSLYASLDVFLKVTRNQPLTIDLTNYKKIQGYPDNRYASLSSLTGYTEVGEIHFDAKGENIYSDEITEIVQLLKNGVIM